MCVYLYVQLFNAKIDVIPLVAMLMDLINVSAVIALHILVLVCSKGFVKFQTHL